MTVGRRHFLLGTAAGLTGFSTLSRAASIVADCEAQQLSFYNIHTSEKLNKIVYREHGELIPGALEEINQYLRDFRTGETHPIDVALLDKLFVLDRQFGPPRGHFEVICGYRSAKTNEALRHVTTGVAKDSLHLVGQAIDVRHTATSTRNLRDAAITLRDGGVGYYANSNFVHVDTGAFRTW